MPATLILSTLFAAGCGSASMSAMASPRVMASPGGEADGEAAPAEAPSSQDEAGDAVTDAKASSEPSTSAARARMVIYRATLGLAVFKPEDVLNKARELTKRAGGWMASMTTREIVLRVPAAKLEPLLEQLASLGEVTGRQIKGEDVTEAFRDLSIRLQNSLKVRERLIALLQQAKTVKDSVLIEKELGRLTERIERLKGKLKYLRDNVRYSTLTLKLQLKSAHAGRLRRLPFYWLRQLGVGQLVSY